MPRWEKGLWPGLPRAARGELKDFLRGLAARWGPFDRVSREYARLTAEAWWTAREASGSAITEGLRRKHGVGRRPSLRDLDRRMKRQGLGVQTFDQLVHRLEALAAANGHSRRVPPTPEALMAALKAEADGGG